jgi:hypothetical protein
VAAAVSGAHERGLTNPRPRLESRLRSCAGSGGRHRWISSHKYWGQMPSRTIDKLCTVMMSSYTQAVNRAVVSREREDFSQEELIRAIFFVDLQNPPA